MRLSYTLTRIFGCSSNSQRQNSGGQMKQRLSLIIAGLLLAAIATYAQNAQDTKSDKSKAAPNAQSTTSEDAQRIATGEITKIDVKKKILTVREAALNQPANNGQNPNAN